MTKDTLKQSIMKELGEGRVKQHAAWFFVVKEYGMWLFAGLTVLFGMFSLAILFAAVDDLRSTLYALQVSGVKGFILLLPYAWAIGMMLFIFIGYNRIRHTKRGYRYPLWLLVSLLVVLSIIGGSIIYTTGFAHDADHYFAEKSELYGQFVNPQYRMWRSPEEGMLGGKVISFDHDTCELQDRKGNIWVIDLSEVSNQHELQNIMPMMRMRVLGESFPDQHFIAKEIFIKDFSFSPPPRKVQGAFGSRFERK